MGTLVLAGATSGSTTLTPVDAVTTVLTLPSATATLATLGANTFTGNQSITGTLGVTGTSTFNTGTFQAAEGAFTGVQVGTGSAGNTGWILGNASNQLAGIWSTGVTPSTTNYFIRGDTGANLYLNASTNVYTRIGNVGVLNVASTGLSVTGTLGVTGTATFTGQLVVDEDTLTVFTAQFPNVGSVQTISIADGYGGYVVITAVQGGIGTSSRTLPFVKRGGSIAIGSSSTAVLTGEPISGVSTSGGNITVTPVAANTYITYAIYYTPLGA